MVSLVQRRFHFRFSTRRSIEFSSLYASSTTGTILSLPTFEEFTEFAPGKVSVLSILKAFEKPILPALVYVCSFEFSLIISAPGKYSGYAFSFPPACFPCANRPPHGVAFGKSQFQISAYTKHAFVEVKVAELPSSFSVYITTQSLVLCSTPPAKPVRGFIWFLA